MNPIPFFNLSKKRENPCLARLDDGERSILAKALVCERVSPIMPIDKPVYTIQIWLHFIGYCIKNLENSSKKARALIG